MEMQKMKETVSRIVMPEETEKRILANCYAKIEEQTMKDRKHIFSRPAAVFAAFLLCFALVGTGVYAGTLRGYFRDITGPDGAVTGTAYDNAEDELSVTLSGIGEELFAEVTMTVPDAFPWSELEALSVRSYTIMDDADNTVISGTGTDKAVITDGRAVIGIPARGLENGTYRLVITGFAGHKKAEYPLEINGTWEILFER